MSGKRNRNLGQDLDHTMICSGATPPELAKALDWFTSTQDWWLAMTLATCVVWRLPTDFIDAIQPSH